MKKITIPARQNEIIKEIRTRETPVFLLAFATALRAGDALAMEVINGAYNDLDVREWVGIGFPFITITDKYCDAVKEKYNLPDREYHDLRARLVIYEQGITDQDIYGPEYKQHYF